MSPTERLIEEAQSECIESMIPVSDKDPQNVKRCRLL